MSTRIVWLTDEELAVLDARCSEKTQAQVDAALARLASVEAHPELTPKESALIADVVTEVETNGRLLYRQTFARTCPVCDARPGFVKFKSGPRRGMDDTKRPKYVKAVELADRFVRVEHSLTLGACKDCMEALAPTLTDALADLRAEVPPALSAPDRPAWKRYDHRHCEACGWDGHEGQMRLLRTMLGDGMYRGGCPECPAENQFLTTKIVRRDGFTVEAA